MHGGQVGGVALHQGGRQLALVQQLLRTVGVGHDVFEQLHALQNARFDFLPVGMAEQEREQIERPGALRLVGGGVDVVSHAVVAHLPLQVRHAFVEVGLAVAQGLAQCVDEALPRRTDGTGFWLG